MNTDKLTEEKQNTIGGILKEFVVMGKGNGDLQRLTVQEQ